MDSASSHAYVSKNFMDAYLKKKQKLKDKSKKEEERPRRSSIGRPEDTANFGAMK